MYAHQRERERKKNRLKPLVIYPVGLGKALSGGDIALRVLWWVCFFVFATSLKGAFLDFHSAKPGEKSLSE